MADEKSFLDSPWIQLGVPLAATAAAAIAPRHAGRVSALGLSAFHGMNQYHQGQERLSQIAHKQKLEEQQSANFDTFVDDLARNDPNYPSEGQGPDDGPAPAGGTTPEADMNAKTAAMDHGVVPKSTFHLSGDKAYLAHRLNKISPTIAHKFIQDEVENYSKTEGAETPAQILARLTGQLPAGASVTGIPLQGKGTFAYNPPEPSKPHFVSGHEGDRTYEVAINPDDLNAVPQRIPVGQHDLPAESQPKVHVFKEGGKAMGVFFTPDGVQKRVVLGTPDQSGEEIYSNLRNKLALRASNQKTGDATFDQQFAKPEDAQAVLKNLQNTNMADVMMQMVTQMGGGGNVGAKKPGI